MPLFRPAMALIGSLVRFARPQTPPCAWPFGKTPGRDWAMLPETLVLALSTVPNRRLVPSKSCLLDVRLFGGPHPSIAVEGAGGVRRRHTPARGFPPHRLES